MILYRDLLELIDNKITGVDRFTWNCFGSFAWCYDSWPGRDSPYCLSAVVDIVDQTVYSVEIHDLVRNRAYRMTHPDYVDAYVQEHKKHGINTNNSEDVAVIELDVVDDLKEKITAIVNNQEYDTRVMMEVNIPDQDLYTYMKLAHKLDITLNELMHMAITRVIEAHKDSLNKKEST